MIFIPEIWQYKLMVKLYEVFLTNHRKKINIDYFGNIERQGDTVGFIIKENPHPRYFRLIVDRKKHFKFFLKNVNKFQSNLFDLNERTTRYASKMLAHVLSEIGSHTTGCFAAQIVNVQHNGTAFEFDLIFAWRPK